MLNKKSRLRKAMLRQEVDRPPCICPGGMMNMVTRELMENTGVRWPEAHTSPRMMADLATVAYEADCFENYGLPFCMTVEAEGFGAKINMGDVTCEPHVAEYSIKSVEEWDRLSPLDCGRGRYKVVLDAIRLLKNRDDGIPIIGNLTGPVSVASSLIEPTIFYKELRKKREGSHRFMEFITEDIMRFGQKQLEAGADFIAISDPSGTGELMGPRLFTEYAVPYLNKIIAGLQKTNPAAGVIVHICGQMHKVYQPLSEIKCNTVSFDAVVNIKEAKQNLPGKVIMGNISTYALEFGDSERISAITRKCLQDGVDIIAPACGMGNETPLANVQAILKTVRAEGRRHE